MSSKLAARRDAIAALMCPEPDDTGTPGRLWGGRFAGGPAEAMFALSRSTHFDWRLAPLRHRRLAGARPRPAPGRICSPTTSWPACSPGWTGSTPRSPPATFEPGADRRGRARRPGAAADRDRRAGARRPAAGRPVAQRPDRHPDPDVPARRTARGRCRGASSSSARCTSRRRPISACRCRDGPTCSRPAGAAVPPPARPRLGRCCATSTGSATWTAGWRSARTARPRWPGPRWAWIPTYVAGQLGFAGSVANSIDGTAARDVVAEAAYVLAQIGVDLSRLSEEIVLWCTPRVRLRHAWPTPGRPGRASCRRRRTPTSPSWPAARPGG